MGQRVIFLNSNQAKSGVLDDHKMHPDYVLLCKFLGCGVIDRTGTLDQGFDYLPLDPIPIPTAKRQTFAELCELEAAEIIALATDRGMPIQVLWSGGIDSTAALIALMKVAEAQGCQDRIKILLSTASIHEYPEFYLTWIKDRYRTKPVSPPLSHFLKPDAITVTGEHGDQLFGIYLLEPYVAGGSAQLDYEDMLPYVLTEHLRFPKRADRVMRYVEKQITEAPVPIKSLFDCLWWFGYSLKWQQVTLRLPVFRREQVQETYTVLHHFFRSTRFQAWSLANPAGKSTVDWGQYKAPAKQYILDFTGDIDYYREKKKELSLKHMIVRSGFRKEHRALVYMRENFEPNFEFVERASEAKSGKVHF